MNERSWRSLACHRVVERLRSRETKVLFRGSEPSSPPSLDTWVKSLEFSACILGREAPINRNATRVPVGLPSREFVL